MAVSHLAVFIRGETGGAPAAPGFERVSAEFPSVSFELGEIENLPSLSLTAEEWESSRFPFYEFDTRVEDLPRLDLAAEPGRLPGMTLEVLTRCQRLVGRRNAASSNPLFDAVLKQHRSLHDLDKPLVRADWAHALDVWQWMVRLDPQASLAVQLAALFHDVERLISEADARIEHQTDDYQGFKDEHARRGAEMADGALEQAGVDAATRMQVARLIAGHERTSNDPDLALLNDADALSFFSLNSTGYVDYFGPEAARRKVAWTLARLRPEARLRLAGVRLRPDVAEMLP
ncbi:MAG TPA: DUF4202 family protein [Thermoanaerobaculia bacterium]|nr:DUF4202 family protein [Thermoanaerobaculia bacterium]